MAYRAPSPGMLARAPRHTQARVGSETKARAVCTLRVPTLLAPRCCLGVTRGTLDRLLGVTHRKLAGADDLYTARAANRQPAPA